MVPATSGCVWSHFRANGHHGTTVAPSRSARSTAARTSTPPMPRPLSALGHARVHQDQPVALDLVDELRDRAVLLDHQAVVRDVVGDLRCGVVAHGGAPGVVAQSRSGAGAAAMRAGSLRQSTPGTSMYSSTSFPSGSST